jgi:hypothetical protein
MEVVVTVALNSPTFAADEFEYEGIKPIRRKSRRQSGCSSIAVSLRKPDLHEDGPSPQPL